MYVCILLRNEKTISPIVNAELTRSSQFMDYSSILRIIGVKTYKFSAKKRKYPNVFLL